MDEQAEQFQERVRAEHGVDIETRSFPEGTETAGDAAAAIGCETAQIASSIALVADELVVVVTSGANRVDTRKLATLRGVHTARMADPEEIEELLGYEIGAVPPLCHDTAVPTYLDDTLLEYETVWAAAGSQSSVFPIDPETLASLTDATVADVVE